MNKWNHLLKCLDALYGFENQVKSSFKKIKQGFDDKSNEHVIIIEYRVMRGDVAVKKKKDASQLRRAANIKVGELIRKVHNQSGGQVLTGEPDSPTESSPIANIP
jgi:hypothetical protein